MNREFSVIIVAAGSGSRLGGDIPKQYIEINGKAILRHTLDIFLSMDGLQDICIVINPEHKNLFQNPISGFDNISFCHGGNTRKDSVHNGIKALSSLKPQDIILVHDAARPFVTRAEITRLLDAMQDNQAATLATPIVDTLRYEHNETSVLRENLWAVQTPQAFHYGLLKQAHENSDDKEYTDDTSLVSKMGVKVKFVAGSKSNFKITSKEDLELAQKLLSTELSTRTHIGQGFDVHAFDNAPAQNIRLCGIDIPHEKTLKGHSDADVVLHALTDAILGAIGEGDIGLHFPPSDNSFKDMDSAKFVKYTMKLLRDKGGELINADITIICESPKISKYRNDIISRLAEIMDICKTCINVKATTTEKLGFTGRGEGIAAQAIVSVSLPICEDKI